MRNLDLQCTVIDHVDCPDYTNKQINNTVETLISCRDRGMECRNNDSVNKHPKMKSSYEHNRNKNNKDVQMEDVYTIVSTSVNVMEKSKQLR